jgi:dedicator of cytokinesis protein 3
VQAVSLQSLAPPAASVPGGGAAYPRPEPSVLIGIFPSAVVHVRQQDAGDDGRLAVAYEKAVRVAQEQAAATSRVGEMEAVREEDEGEGLVSGGVSGPSGHTASNSVDANGVNVDGTSRKRRSVGPGGGMGRSNRPKSLLLESMQATNQEEDKEQPPLPQLTAGDATLAGAQWPLVDEIACAIREWYGVSQANRGHDSKRLHRVAAADISRQ